MKEFKENSLTLVYKQKPKEVTKLPSYLIPKCFDTMNLEFIHINPILQDHSIIPLLTENLQESEISLTVNH